MDVACFKTMWDRRCAEIKDKSLDSRQCADLQHSFVLEIGLHEIQNGWTLTAADIATLHNELRLALHFAYANYRKQGNWFTRTVKEMRLPDVVLNKH